MARDVAQRELDQSGFRITNLGTPTAAGDATKTDNTSTPKPGAGEGSPGTSLLAAAADHVHPASPSGANGALALVLDDPSLQAVSGETAIIWETSADPGPLLGNYLELDFRAIAFVTSGVGKLHVKVGGDAGQADGEHVVEVAVANGGAEVVGGRAKILNPGVPVIVKLVASSPSAEAVLKVRGKIITMRSADAGA